MHTPAAFHAERIAWRTVIYLNLIRSALRFVKVSQPFHLLLVLKSILEFLKLFPFTLKRSSNWTNGMISYPVKLIPFASRQKVDGPDLCSMVPWWPIMTPTARVLNLFMV